MPSNTSDHHPIAITLKVFIRNLKQLSELNGINQIPTNIGIILDLK
jgi:hypothetical protein